MIDLHCHSAFSDGSDPPEALAAMADQLGLTALALTDHDTVDGLPSFLACQPSTPTRLLAGVELSAGFLGRSLHVVGLFVDPGDGRFRRRLEELRLRRDARNEAMVKRLGELGAPVSLDAVQSRATSRVVSRVHFALALVEAGHASSQEDAFRRWIGDRAPAFVPRRELSPGEAADWIRQAGGLPFVAHPGRFAGRGFRWEEAILDLKKEGMAGLEAYYGDQAPTEEAAFLRLAREAGVLVAGGSDYHGAHKEGISLGTGRGRLLVPDGILAPMEIELGH